MIMHMTTLYNLTVYCPEFEDKIKHLCVYASEIKYALEHGEQFGKVIKIVEAGYDTEDN